MIVIVLAILGTILGWRMAAKRGGNRLDKLQYAAVYFLIAALIGLFLTVLVERLI
nr:apolipoprotein acyltransferase [uncultured Celeribacter sp.]